MDGCWERRNIFVSCNKCVIDNIDQELDLLGLSCLYIFVGLFWTNSNSVLCIWQRNRSRTVWEGQWLTGGCRNGIVIIQCYCLYPCRGFLIDPCDVFTMFPYPCCWRKGLSNWSFTCFCVISAGCCFLCFCYWCNNVFV